MCGSGVDAVACGAGVVTVSGGRSVDRFFARLGATGDEMGDAFGQWVLGSQSLVRGNARGRPGPRAVTGDYNRSIVGQWEKARGGWVGQIGTNADQGPRLEYGFVGTDVLGRRYNQPPYPHFSPAVKEIEKLGEDLLGGYIRDRFQ